MAWQTIKKTFNNSEYESRAKKQCKRKLNNQCEKFLKAQLKQNRSYKNDKKLMVKNFLYESDCETNEDVENFLANICTNTDFNISESKNSIVNKGFQNGQRNLKKNHWLKPNLLNCSRKPFEKLNQLIVEDNSSSDEENTNMTNLIKRKNDEHSCNCRSIYSKSFQHKQLLPLKKKNCYNSNALTNAIHITSDNSDSTQSDNDIDLSNKIVSDNSENSSDSIKAKQKSRFQNKSSYVNGSNINFKSVMEKQPPQDKEICSQHSEICSKIEIEYLSSATESSTGNYTKILSQTSTENENKESDGEKELELLIRDLQSYQKSEIIGKRIKPKKGGYVEKFRSVLRSDRSNYYFWRNEYENSRIEGGLIGDVVEVNEVFKQTLLKIATENENFLILVDLRNKIYKGQNFSVGTKIIFDIDSEPLICDNVKIYIGVNKIMSVNNCANHKILNDPLRPFVL